MRRFREDLGLVDFQPAAIAIINILSQYWAYVALPSIGLAGFLLRNKITASERKAAAEREQTFFLAILYILLKSGKTIGHALSEAASKKEIIQKLSAEAGYLRRMGEKTTLGESFSKYVHPSREFSLLVGSLGEDLESGFGVVEKLEKLLEQSTARESERWSRYVGTVETLGESVVSVILLVPLMYIVGSILGGFPPIYVVTLTIGAAAAFYVIAASSEPLHIVDVPKPILIASIIAILVSGGLLSLLFVDAKLTIIPLAVGIGLLAWGLYVHFRYIRKSISEGEAAFLLLDGVAARLRAGYPVGRSLEAVSDPRYARYAKAIARGLILAPLNRFMRLSIETVRLARLGGLGSEALSLMSRLAITIYLSFTNARARMKLYDSIAIASGAAIVIISSITILPFTTLPPQLSAEVGKLLITPTLEPVLPSAILVAFTLGVAVARTEDQTVAATWRAGAGILATLFAYWIASPFL